MLCTAFLCLSDRLMLLLYTVTLSLCLLLKLNDDDDDVILTDFYRCSKLTCILKRLLASLLRLPATHGVPVIPGYKPPVSEKLLPLTGIGIYKQVSDPSPRHLPQTPKICKPYL